MRTDSSQGVWRPGWAPFFFSSLFRGWLFCAILQWCSLTIASLIELRPVTFTAILKV